uniref:Uncharacterized protein n=1 Tax=Acrobeloides nanus TaxID=290746 RepID=A0A914EJ71_9BILA
MDDPSEWTPRALKVSKNFTNINNGLGELYTLGFEFVRQFLLSNLLLNNFGRSVRQTQHLIDVHCAERKRLGVGMIKLGELGITDFEPLLNSEWFHNLIHIGLLFLAVLTNFYTLFILYKVRNLTSRTSRQLFYLLLFANIVFICTNIWLLIEQNYPIIPEENCAEFVSRQDYDGDLWPDVVFFANIGTFRMIKYDRYVPNTVRHENPPLKAILAILFMIVQNLFLNLSRTIAAMVLLCIMCFFFYELRGSFGGKASDKISPWPYYAFISALGVLSFIYVLMGLSQYKVIDKINESIIKFRHFDTMDTNKTSCMDSHDNFPLETFFIKFHAFFTLFAHVSSAVALLLLLCYHETKMITMDVKLTSGSLAEMRKAIRSLIYATIVYILSNIGLTMVEVRIMTSNCKGNNGCIVELSYSYHWFYLLSLVDPIIQPIIILFRIKTMQNYHNHIVKRWKRFNLATFLKNTIICVHNKFRNKSVSKLESVDFNPKTTSVQYNPSVHLTKMPKKSSLKRPAERRIIDTDLQRVLRILEEERNQRE